VSVSVKPRLLLVDISGLTFIDSAALHEIVRAHRELRAAGCLLALVGPNRQVARILELSALDQVLSAHATAEGARAMTARIDPGAFPASMAD
jgi:anti-anti-sigma factor